ncbi:OmpH family outer membrane protein [Thiolapillus sp.]
MPRFRLLVLSASLFLSSGCLLAVAPTPQPASADTATAKVIETDAPAAMETLATTSSAPTDQPPAMEAPPYNRSYQAARQSHDELVKSMQARRDALRKQMEKRRDEIARKRAEFARQRHGALANQPLQQQRQEELATRQKKLEEQKLAFQQEMEARRKAMEARINRGINAIGRSNPAPYYPAPARPPHPGYIYPYGSYAPPGR